MSIIDQYRAHVQERAQQNIPPLPLNEHQTAEVIQLLESAPADQSEDLLQLLLQRVPPGVDKAAMVKVSFLTAVARGEIACSKITPIYATEILGTMLGGYNVQSLIELLDHPEVADMAATSLEHTLVIFDSFHDVQSKMEAGNERARAVIESWAEARWFERHPPVADEIELCVFRVLGETNTDSLSPAPDAWSRADIPLHANAMLKMAREGIVPDEPGVTGPMKLIQELKQMGQPLVYVGDVVGTGSSRKSAVNSLLWHFGDDIPYIPNKRAGGYCFGGKIAPIFFNTLEDSGALPIEMDVSTLSMGDQVVCHPHAGILTKQGAKDIPFSLRPDAICDEVRAGGRIRLIVGRELTTRARNALKLGESSIFIPPAAQSKSTTGFTLAQKMVGRACGVEGVLPGTYCEPRVSSVGSQDTTGPMTRDELKDLACLGFSCDLVLQSFCHTAAYPKPVDVQTHASLPSFFATRGGVSLRPGDGIIHSWLNRMLLPDTVGTGADSHTRFPVGISFPAGSGLVAFAATTGVMPLDMPESVLVRFHGQMQPGITLRDLVNAIPYFAEKQGLLTLDKANKKNIFSGRVLEIEGLPKLKAEQAFELSDASAERSATACTIALDQEPIIEYLRSNITLLHWMIANGYKDQRALERRIEAMESWLADPQLMRADPDASYAATIEIDLAQVTEPLLACPNDPDDIKPLSAVAGDKVDEVFIGSCMTNIGHFRAAGKLLDGITSLPTRLWVVPPTMMDAHLLRDEGYYAIFGRVGARIEMPGCSLCMGNQARVQERSTVVSTSTRNFPNRLGDGANVYLSSAELAALSATLGRLPSVEEYMAVMSKIDTQSDDIYRYMQFDQIESYRQQGGDVIPIAESA